MRKHTLVGLLLAAAALCGCVSFIDNPYFAVKESGLNWVSIRHYNYRVKPIQRVAVRIDGNGIVTVRDADPGIRGSGRSGMLWLRIREPVITHVWVVYTDEIERPTGHLEPGTLVVEVNPAALLECRAGLARALREVRVG